MFNQIYLDNIPGTPLTQWTKARLISGGFGSHELLHEEQPRALERSKELGVILSTITWFLEKLALRGEITWSDPSIPLEENLKFFEEIIMRSFDTVEEKKV